MLHPALGRLHGKTRATLEEPKRCGHSSGGARSGPRDLRAFTSTGERMIARTKQYTKEHWQRPRSEQDVIYAAAAVLMNAGTAPTGDAAMGLAERYRRLIDRWFYPCRVEAYRTPSSRLKGVA
jgi:hypothetical protein